MGLFPNWVEGPTPRIKRKTEKKALMCIYKKKECVPQQLKMAPKNICVVSEMKCKRLKRKKKTDRRRIKRQEEE